MGEDLLRDLSLKAEVEKGNRFLDGNIRYTETAERQNFAHTIVASDNNILILGREDVLLATLYYWEDYLNYIQHKCGWLVCLKAALDIFNGELKGYYGVPYITQYREELLMGRLKDLAKEGIRSMIKNFHGHRVQNEYETDHRKDDSAIKVAIEFCHEINSFEFLFTTIFKEFTKEGFEDKFVENLEPFILSGYFKDELLPNEVLKKI